MAFPVSKLSFDTKSHHSICHFSSFLIARITRSGGKPSREVVPWRLKTLLRSPRSNECVETFEIAKSKRNFPTFQKRPCFLVKHFSPLCGTNKNPRKSPQTLHIYVPLCMFHRTAETTKHTEICVCMKEMDGGAVRGTSGTWQWHRKASPSLILPLSHTPPSTSLLSSASQSWLLWGSV